MNSTPIHATDEIVIPHPTTKVWPVLVDFAGYPRWWPKSLGIRLLSGGAGLLGTEVELSPLGGQPFRCRVERVDVLKCIQLRYVGEFIDGVGEWRLEPLEQETRVVYRLEVEVRGWLVVLLGKVLNLARIHSWFMQSVLHNLDNVLERTEKPAKRSQ